MVRVRAGESFTVAVQRDRRLFQAAVPKEGITAGASTGVTKESNGTGAYAPATPPSRMRPERAGDPHKRKNSVYSRRETPPSRVRSKGAGVPKKSKVSGYDSPVVPPPREMRTEGAVVPEKSKGSGSCGPAMSPPREVRTKGAGVSQKSKGFGSFGPEMPPQPGMRTEGGGLAVPPSRMQPEGAGELELTVEDISALDCGMCFLPLKPPIFQCNNGHVMCSLCHDKLKATGKCHVCGVTIDGNSRCRAMERLAESIRFLCQNAAYGCTARLVYHDREGHQQKCLYSPCCCPDKACGFSGPMESLLDHFPCVHGWPSFTTAPASSHFNVSLHDGFNFLRADDHVSCSPGILFLLNVVRSPLGLAISMLCIDTCATNNGHGQFSKEPIECEVTYLRYVGSKSHSTGDQLTDYNLRCKFRVAVTDLSDGLPSADDCSQFVVPNFALGAKNKETIEIQGRIFIS